MKKLLRNEWQTFKKVSCEERPDYNMWNLFFEIECPCCHYKAKKNNICYRLAFSPLLLETRVDCAESNEREALTELNRLYRKQLEDLPLCCPECGEQLRLKEDPDEARTGLFDTVHEYIERTKKE